MAKSTTAKSEWVKTTDFFRMVMGTEGKGVEKRDGAQGWERKGLIVTCIKETSESKGEWSVIHKASGMRSGNAPIRKKAIELADKLHTLPIDWTKDKASVLEHAEGHYATMRKFEQETWAK